MSVLDELQEVLLGGLTPDDQDIFADFFADTFRDFEAAHPGLVDKTDNCANCGLPRPNYYADGSGGPMNNPGWEYVWTFAGPKWLDQSEVDNEELHSLWLCCPACTKEAS